jgi:dTMP kinase
MSKGLFISFEGGEGAGKSTVLRAVCSALDERAIAYCTTREPGGTVLGEALRALVLDPAHKKICSESELLMMFASRAQLVKEFIQPALEAGTWVISDRYTDASFAYQGGGRGVDQKRIEDLEQWAAFGLKPERTYLLDLPVSEGLKRVSERGQAFDRMESEAELFFERVRLAYLDRAQKEPKRIVVIDARKPLEYVVAQVIQDLKQLVVNWQGKQA